MSDNLIAVESVKKYYGRNLIIEDISFKIHRGDICVFLGVNGCGKTTLLRIVCGLELPSGGTVKKSSICHSMSYISQRCALLPWRTAFANITVALEFAGVPKKEQKKRALHCLEIVGLASKRDHFPHQLSGGMRQKIALARAIATEAKLICMDEPFNSLDFCARADAQKKTLELCDHLGIAVVFVTHDIDEALHMATKLYILSSSPTTILEELTINKEASEIEQLYCKGKIRKLFNISKVAAGELM